MKSISAEPNSVLASPIILIFDEVLKKSRRHALGQHFLKNPQLINKIIDHISPQREDLIIEIGPGEGGLTRQLATKVGQVIAIEKDARLASELKQLNLPQVTIVSQDVLSIDIQDLTSGKIAKVIGNLPYAITTPLLHKVLEAREVISEGHFLVQKEAADKLCAVPGSKKFGPLSLLLQNHFDVRLRFSLGPGAFSPPPKVDSAFVSLKKRDEPQFTIENDARFQDFIYAAFRQRRKTIVNNLKPMGLSLANIKSALQHCDITENTRPEQISLSQFVQLYRFL